ncbi:MAG: DMT family protein [Bacteroidota bacterium]|nr:DMT family protein [Candidatus Kapabacteria bacterium]MDW8220442.1 DMT family protein [Bacteroidota bacterium]
MIFVVLLIVANVFMTAAWYWHLRFARGEHQSLAKLVLISWGIAFFEYCLQVPANRLGYRYFSATQLKIMQEAVSILVFLVFAIVVLHERLQWNYILAFTLIVLAVYFAVGFKSS